MVREGLDIFLEPSTPSPSLTPPACWPGGPLYLAPLSRPLVLRSIHSTPHWHLCGTEIFLWDVALVGQGDALSLPSYGVPQPIPGKSLRWLIPPYNQALHPRQPSDFCSFFTLTHPKALHLVLLPHSIRLQTHSPGTITARPQNCVLRPIISKPLQVLTEASSQQQDGHWGRAL